MILAASIVAVLAIILVVMAILVRVEEGRARRFFADRARSFLDDKILMAEHKWEYHWKHFSRYILQLGWYYSIHSLLRTLLKSLVSVYSYFETVFERNRLRTRELRQEFRRHLKQTHLTEIARHKKDTTLSPAEQEALKTKKLEQDH